MKILSLLALVFGFGVLGCSSKSKVLGKLPNDPSSTVLAINAGDAPPRVKLQGTMIEKCPQAGCWFRLDDGTGVMKIDTKTAGFVVLDIPLNTKVLVAGKVRTDGSEPLLEASGLSY